MTKIAVIGCGNIGSAFVTAWLKNGILTPKDLLIIESNPDRARELRLRFGCSVDEKPSTTIKNFEFLILAVKPQEFYEMARLVAPFVDQTHIIISMITGVKIGIINEHFGISGVVRTMPNLPVKVGRGLTVMAYPKDMDPGKAQLSKSLFEAVGKALIVNDENLLDVATAVSASGPGFVYYVLEQFVEATKELGYTDDDARQMVEETFIGSIELLRQSGDAPQALRAQVTSKAGTTAAGISIFEREGVGLAVREGIRAAYNRAVELGKK